MIPLGIMAAAGRSLGAYELITSQILASNSGGVLSFTSIPQDYKHLQIRLAIRTLYSGAENLYMRFNSTTYSFSGHNLNGSGTTVTSGSYTGSNYADLMPVSNAAKTSGVFSSHIIDILDYASTSKNKTIRAVGGLTDTSVKSISLRSSLLISTDAISSISEIGGSSGNGLLAGSRISLYGIRG